MTHTKLTRVEERVDAKGSRVGGGGREGGYFFFLFFFFLFFFLKKVPSVKIYIYIFMEDEWAQNNAIFSLSLAFDRLVNRVFLKHLLRGWLLFWSSWEPTTLMPSPNSIGYLKCGRCWKRGYFSPSFSLFLQWWIVGASLRGVNSSRAGED